MQSLHSNPTQLAVVGQFTPEFSEISEDIPEVTAFDQVTVAVNGVHN
jgi:hypothetical protein